MAHQPGALDQQQSCGLPFPVDAWLPDRSGRQRRSGGQQRVDGIALAGTPGASRRPINLGDLCTDYCQRSAEPGSVAAGSLDRPQQSSAGDLFGHPRQ